MWSRSHAPWEAAARPADDENDSIEQAESRRIEEILKQNGTSELVLLSGWILLLYVYSKVCLSFCFVSMQCAAIGALGARSSPGNELQSDSIHHQPSLNWSPPKRRKTVVQVVSSTDFGWARDFEHERHNIQSRQGPSSAATARRVRRSLPSEQTIDKPAQKLVSPPKVESCNKPRRVIGEKFWKLDGTWCWQKRKKERISIGFNIYIYIYIYRYRSEFGYCFRYRANPMHCVASLSIDTCLLQLIVFAVSFLDTKQNTTAEYAWKRFHVRLCPWWRLACTSFASAV